MTPMSYEEFASSVRLFFIDKTTGWNLVFSITLLVIAIVFIAWFAVYLRKQYKYHKKNTDTFDSTTMTGDFNYPGFHKGVKRDEVPQKNKDEKGDKWGKIGDD